MMSLVSTMGWSFHSEAVRKHPPVSQSLVAPQAWHAIPSIHHVHGGELSTSPKASDAHHNNRGERIGVGIGIGNWQGPDPDWEHPHQSQHWPGGNQGASDQSWPTSPGTFVLKSQFYKRTKLREQKGCF